MPAGRSALASLQINSLAFLSAVCNTATIDTSDTESSMMAIRSIPISTDVYAAIWRAQEPGEETEEAILRRILKVPSSVPSSLIPPQQHPTKVGFSDPRFGIELPEGFEIFRVYKGTEFRAKAVDGKWLLMSTGEMYPSLNQLSRATSGNTENAWNNWYYLDKSGKRQLV